MANWDKLNKSFEEGLQRLKGLEGLKWFYDKESLKSIAQFNKIKMNYLKMLEAKEQINNEKCTIMKTQEKAKKMVVMFESIAHPTIDCDKQFAKEAAIRCADELIQAFKSSACRDVHMEYWIEVKQEIEKL